MGEQITLEQITPEQITEMLGESECPMDVHVHHGKCKEPEPTQVVFQATRFRWPAYLFMRFAIWIGRFEGYFL